MTNIDFFKKQAKNFFKDYNTRVFNEEKNIYEYSPRFFDDIEDLVDNFEIDENGSFTLMNAQHIVARLSGFYKWTELIKASEPALELGKLLLTNRESYQEKMGIITNMVQSLIVSDWQSYEELYLKDCDDQTKLETFKEIFLDEAKPKRKKAPIFKLDFRDDFNAQDMLSKIMKEKHLSPEKAVLSCITQKNCVTILATGWADIAVSMWGHDDPYRKFEELETPQFEIKLSKDKIRLLEIVMEKERVPFDRAVLYFMIFTLESLGYHI